MDLFDSDISKDFAFHVVEELDKNLIFLVTALDDILIIYNIIENNISESYKNLEQQFKIF